MQHHHLAAQLAQREIAAVERLQHQPAHVGADDGRRCPRLGWTAAGRDDQHQRRRERDRYSVFSRSAHANTGGVTIVVTITMNTTAA